MSDKVEYVYLFTNPAMPDYVKVGKTNNIKNRLNGLYKETCLPLRFECYAHIVINPHSGVDATTIESNLHHLLEKSITKNKEFFKTDKEEVLDFFRTFVKTNPKLKLVMGAGTDKSTKKKAGPTTFELLDIPIGSILVYTGDSSKVCEVADAKNQVVYEGQNYSLSDLACRLCGYRVSGYQRFTFGDELLADRKRRLHPEL